jgi:hypothetical protein
METKFNNKQMIAQYKFITGMIFRKLDNPERGLQVLQESLSYFNDMNDLMGQFHTLIAIVQTNEELEQKQIREQKENIFDIDSSKNETDEDGDIFMNVMPFTPLTSSTQTPSSSQSSTISDKTRDTKRKVLERIRDTKQLAEHITIIKVCKY